MAPVLAVVVLLGAGCGPGSGEAPGATTAVGQGARPAGGGAGEGASGERIFAARCAPCHGPGAGANQVPLKPADLMAKYPTREALLAAIRDGNEAAGMPRWGSILTADELAAVSDYVRSLGE